LNELNITGGVDEARKNLTTFTKDTIDDVKEMKRQLEATQDEIIDRERKLRQQASQLKELKSSENKIEKKKEATERHLTKIEAKKPSGPAGNIQQSKLMDQANILNTQKQGLQTISAKRQNKIDGLIKDLSPGQKSAQIDKAVKFTIGSLGQSKRRTLTKASNGLFSTTDKRGDELLVLIEMVD
jgi:predicted  nucleic acid-binding Zn-ribbon protein